jgi:hypothetical protein
MLSQIQNDIIVKDWLRVDRFRKEGRVFLNTQIRFWTRTWKPEIRSGHFRNWLWNSKMMRMSNPRRRLMRSQDLRTTRPGKASH